MEELSPDQDLLGKIINDSNPVNSTVEKTKQQLEQEILELGSGYAAKIFEVYHINKQNNYLMDTIKKMVEAICVLRGGKGHYVAMHVFKIVNEVIETLKSEDEKYSKKKNVQKIEAILEGGEPEKESVSEVVNE